MMKLRIVRRLAASFAFLLAAGTAAAEAAEIQRVVSPGGIEAWLVEEDAVPVVAVSFAFVGGAAQDPADKPGVANMVSGLLDEGAGDLDSATFQSKLDEYSIELSFDAGPDAFYGRFRTLAENREEAAKLVKLALGAPRFDSEPVERIRAQIFASLRNDDRDPESVADRTLMETAFPGHPYGRPTDGTEQSVAAITVDDLKAFRDHTFARDNLKIAVVGAIDAATLGRLLDEMFGDLSAKADLKPVPEVAVAGPARKDVTMAIPQAVIQIAGNGMKREDPDFIAASVVNQILGGGTFSSRLYSSIREKRGLAYSVSTGLSAYDHAGMVSGQTSTRADQSDKVIGLMQDEMARLAADGPTEDELAKAKSYITGAYAIRFTTSSQIAGQLLAIQMDNLGKDYPERRNSLIAAVTLDDARRVAKRLFGGDRFVVVRVGPPAS
jgi:zinc protease